MITVATKIKSVAATAAVAAILATGFAGAAAAQSSNPFAGGEGEQTTPTPFTRTTPTDPNLNPNRGNQFGNRREATPKSEFRTNPFAGEDRKSGQYDNADERLARYLVGKWNGRLNNGQSVRVAFLQDGRFAIAMNGSDVAQVGRYTVSGGMIRLRLAAMCSLSTKRCQRYNQVKSLTIGFRPINSRSLRVQDGILHRAA